MATRSAGFVRGRAGAGRARTRMGRPDEKRVPVQTSRGDDNNNNNNNDDYKLIN